mgnify:CR=1 FL=1
MTERLDNLILVDVFDNPIGTADKRRAHTVPLLHRAFSVFPLAKWKRSLNFFV